MKYTQRTFSVPASSTNKPEGCKHEWLDSRNNCVLCGITEHQRLFLEQSLEQGRKCTREYLERIAAAKKPVAK